MGLITKEVTLNYDLLENAEFLETGSGAITLKDHLINDYEGMDRHSLDLHI
jgi:hypothetical protein